MRNSVSHFHVVFKGQNDYIAKIEMWDEDPKTKITQWKAEFDVFILKKFVVYFIRGIIDRTLIDQSKLPA
jgi:hypothetical protein